MQFYVDQDYFSIIFNYKFNSSIVYASKIRKKLK